jgi:hypothetical protein
MSTSMNELLGILTDEADRAADVSPLALRLLSDGELDCIGAGGSPIQTGAGSQRNMPGENSVYRQGSSAYFQSANSFSYRQS